MITLPAPYSCWESRPRNVAYSGGWSSVCIARWLTDVLSAGFSVRPLARRRVPAGNRCGFDARDAPDDERIAAPGVTGFVGIGSGVFDASQRGGIGSTGSLPEQPVSSRSSRSPSRAIRVSTPRRRRADAVRGRRARPGAWRRDASGHVVSTARWSSSRCSGPSAWPAGFLVMVEVTNAGIACSTAARRAWPTPAPRRRLIQCAVQMQLSCCRW